jgi:hypothetical protein
MENAIFGNGLAALIWAPILLIGLLLLRVVLGGVTVRKVMYGLIGIALVGLADFGGLICLMVWTYRDQPTMVKASWWWPLTLLIAPLLGYYFVLAKLLRSPQLEEVPPEPEGAWKAPTAAEVQRVLWGRAKSETDSK